MGQLWLRYVGLSLCEQKNNEHNMESFQKCYEILCDINRQNMSSTQKHHFPLPPHLHDREKLVQYVGSSEEYFKSVVKVMIEQTKPLYHTIPVMAADKFRLIITLCVHTYVLCSVRS